MPYTPSKEAQQIIYLVENGNVDKLEELLKDVDLSNTYFGIHLPTDGILNNKELSLEIKKKLFEVLLENGFDIDTFKLVLNEPFLIDCFREYDFEMIKFIIEKGARIDYSNEKWNEFLDTKNFGSKIETILACGISLEHIGEALFCNTIFYSHVEGVKKLLDLGMNPNDIKDAYGWPAFLNACARGNYEIIKLFVERGCNINTTTPDGQTGLMRAVFNGDIKVIDYLINNGADIALKTKERETCVDFIDLNAEATKKYLETLGMVVPLKQKIETNRLIIEAIDKKIELDFSIDDGQWEDLYNSGELIMNNEPDQYQEENIFVGLISSHFSLQKTIDIIIDDAGLISSETEIRLKSYLN